MFLADTGDENNAAMPGQLKDYVKSGFVSLRRDTAGMSRTSVYRDCMVEQRHKYNWLAFIDTDEFIVMRKQYAPPPSAKCADRVAHIFKPYIVLLSTTSP